MLDYIVYVSLKIILTKAHLDCKSIIKAYPGCLLSYFDINKEVSL